MRLSPSQAGFAYDFCRRWVPLGVLRYLETVDAEAPGSQLLHPDETPYHESSDGDVQEKVDEVHRALIRSDDPFSLAHVENTHISKAWCRQQQQQRGEE